jgi:hypothetical protein
MPPNEQNEISVWADLKNRCHSVFSQINFNQENHCQHMLLLLPQAWLKFFRSAFIQIYLWFFAISSCIFAGFTMGKPKESTKKSTRLSRRLAPYNKRPSSRLERRASEVEDRDSSRSRHGQINNSVSITRKSYLQSLSPGW